MELVSEPNKENKGVRRASTARTRLKYAAKQAAVARSLLPRVMPENYQYIMPIWKIS